MLRVYFCVDTPLILLPDGEYVIARSVDAYKQYLEPPEPEREFLISPPGSPPVGWEPRLEDGPNKETLAQDLIEALHKLTQAPEAEAEAEHLAAGEHVILSPSTEASGAPGVTVHATDSLAPSTAPPAPISSAKATADSLQGPARPAMQPTARPPM